MLKLRVSFKGGSLSRIYGTFAGNKPYFVERIKASKPFSPCQKLENVEVFSATVNLIFFVLVGGAFHIKSKTILYQIECFGNYIRSSH